ncbi:MAG: hypothetical protein Salg2KO_10660 [Salibacteraceae bacterium]
MRADAISGLVDGDSITVWADTSGNDNDVSQPVISLKPDFFADSVNGMPIVSFNSANARLRRNPFSGFATTNITGIYVNRTTESNDGILSYASSGGNNNFLFFRSNNIAIYRDNNVATGVSVNDDEWNIVQGSWGSSGGRVELWKNGRKDYNNTGFRSGTSITSGGSLCIAHEQDSPDGGYAANQDHTGDFTEVIFYNTYIDSTDHIIIANYLSAKYNIALAANDLYDEDDTLNGNYDYEVAGIGRQSATSLNTDAQGSSILRILNADDLDNNEYMIWGHDNGPRQASEFGDVPATVVARLERVWRVSEVNSAGTAVDVGNVDVRFDLSSFGSIDSTDLRLLVDVDNDGVFSDETVGTGGVVTGASLVGGGVYVFEAVSALANNLRFTLSTVDTASTPLPIDLLSFNASALDNTAVLLSWKTASEINNERFVVQRSVDAQTWQTIEELAGYGNSDGIKRYSTEDSSTLSGISYYRLKQIDFDGKTTYSQVRSVRIRNSRGSHLKVYPNPTDNVINIVGNEGGLTNLKVFNVMGSDITSQTRLVGKADSYRVSIDLSQLAPGVYFIIGDHTYTKVTRR